VLSAIEIEPGSHSNNEAFSFCPAPCALSTRCRAGAAKQIAEKCEAFPLRGGQGGRRAGPAPAPTGDEEPTCSTAEQQLHWASASLSIAVGSKPAAASDGEDAAIPSFRRWSNLHRQRARVR